MPDLSLLIKSSVSGSLLLLLVSLVALLWGLRSSASRRITNPPLWISLASGALSLLTLGALQWISCTLCLLSGITYSLSCEKTAPQQQVHLSRRATVALYFIGSISILLLLLANLSLNLDRPLVWESVVASSFIAELQDFSIVAVLGKRLLWSEGLLSEGNLSLPYGLPTALLLNVSSSLFSARIVSVILFLATALLLGLICRRFMSHAVGVTTLFAFGLNEVGLTFGRYGSSIAATLFSVSLALWCCARCVAQPTVWRVFLVLAALYLATLGYAPGRLITLLLLGWTTVGILNHHGAAQRTRFLLTGILCSGVMVMLFTQHHFGRVNSFVSARGEQFLLMFESRMWPDEMLPLWEEFLKEKRPPEFSDYVRLGSALIQKTTGPQLLELASPFHQAKVSARLFYADPLHQDLYAPCLFPFLVLGILLSRKRCSRWWFWMLLSWVATATAPVLLTNRVDAYRTCMLLIPIAIYIALGISEAYREARKSEISAWVAGALACCAVVITTESRLDALSEKELPRTLTDRVIEQLDSTIIDQSIVAAEEQEFRGRAQTQLLLRQRKQKGLPCPAKVLSEEELRVLAGFALYFDDDQGREVVDKLRGALDSGASVILDSSLLTTKLLSKLGGERIKQSQSPLFGDWIVILKK